ncbi:MAG: dynamin family protein [Bacteroidota bacterium]
MTINSTRTFLKEKVAKGELSTVIDLMIKHAAQLQNENTYTNEIYQISARYKEIQTKVRTAVIDNEQEKIDKNQICKSLLDLIDLQDFQDSDIIISSIPYEQFRLSKLDDTTFFKEIEQKVEAFFREMEIFQNTLSERNPAYEWSKEFDQQIQSVLKKWNKRRFQIAVMALVKSGKSTLLNSWIGNEYLPSASVAETMRIIRIRHNPKRITGVLYDNKKEVARGVEQVRKYIRELNQSSRQLSKKEKESELLLEVDIAALNQRELSGYQFDILDTPGTNEAHVASLRAKVERIAKTSDVIIYLLDYTKLKTKDEEWMFESLKGWRKELFEQIELRLFFVVNKIDTANRHDKEKNMSPDGIRKYIRKIIKDTIDVDLNLQDIILISAENALLSRLIQSGTASEDQIWDFKQKAFGDEGAEDASMKDCLRVVPRRLQRSGFADLEEKVIEVIYQKRSEILLSSTLDDLEKYVEQVKRNLLVAKGTLLTDIEEIEKLQSKIIEIKEEIHLVFKDTDKFKKKAVKIVEQQLNHFKDEVSKQIKLSFSGSSATHITTNEWFRGITDYFNLTEFELRSTSPLELENQLRIIHRHVIIVLGQQFDLIWNKIMESLYFEYIGLRTDLETKTNPLTRRIEKVINETLKIELSPASLLDEPISLDNFYHQTELELDRLVQSQTKSNMSFLESIWNFFLRIFGGGKEEYRYKEFSVSSKVYAKYMKESTDDLIEEAKELAVSLMGEYYLAEVDKMQKDLDHYAQRYIDITQDEIEQKKKGVTDIPTRISLIESDMSQSDSLLNILEQNRIFVKR